MRQERKRRSKALRRLRERYQERRSASRRERCWVAGDRRVPGERQDLKPTAETAKAVHKGKTYYLCCGGCVKKFAANPDKYAM